jgi:hypothetical protein
MALLGNVMVISGMSDDGERGVLIDGESASLFA